MCPSLIEIGSKTTEKNSAQTNRQTNRETNRQTYRQTDTTKIMVTWPWTNTVDYHILLLHPFNGLFSRTTWVSWHQKGKPFWILLQQEMTGWQWHELDHMQIICTSLQTDSHASTSPLSFYRLDILPATQPTASKHLRQYYIKNTKKCYFLTTEMEGFH